MEDTVHEDTPNLAVYNIRENCLSKEDIEANLSDASTVEEVVQSYLGIYNIHYVTASEILAKIESLLLADNRSSNEPEELKAALDKLVEKINSVDYSKNSHEQLYDVRHEMLLHFGGSLKFMGEFSHFSKTAYEAAGCKRHEGNMLQIEDSFTSGYGGMLRIFTGDVTYLWLTYLIDRGGDNWETPKLRFIGAAISCYDLPDDEPEHLPVFLEGEKEPRYMRTSVPSFWFQTNFNSGRKVEFAEIMYDGIFNSTHVQVKVDGQESGYYFSY
jgi:hypothetical protein